MKNAMSRDQLLPRHAAAQVEQALTEARVVLVNGPRQAGKTTLVRDQLDPEIPRTFLTLDDEAQLEACLADPVTYLDRRGPVTVDEFQRGGDALLRAVKLLVDRDPTPGRFLLTGSTRFVTVPTISESLAGRVRIVDLWPLTQGEILQLGSGDRFLSRLLAGAGPTSSDAPPLTRADYFDAVCRGGFPEAQRLPPPARRRFFRDYVRTVTQRDVPEISRIRHIDELPRILRYLAGATASQFKDTELSARLSIDRRTLRANYLPLLQTVYLALELPAWSRNIVSRVSKHPKSYLVDTGLASHLLGVDPARLGEPTAAMAGPLMETFVVNELIRQASLLQDAEGVSLFHYRAHTGAEVDLIAEASDGRTIAIEVKAGVTVRAADLNHLASVRRRVDELPDLAFTRGVVLYAGEQHLSFGDRLDAIPISALWRT